MLYTFDWVDYPYYDFVVEILEFCEEMSIIPPMFYPIKGEGEDEVLSVSVEGGHPLASFRIGMRISEILRTVNNTEPGRAPG